MQSLSEDQKGVFPMPETVSEVLSQVEERMKKAIQSTQNELGTLRTGRANTKIFDRVQVSYYGTMTPLNQMANISTPDAQTILIQPYDKGVIAEIEKAIATSDLGLTPNNDGQVIRINIPALTEERRKDMVKVVKKTVEEGKVAIRNIRRDGVDDVKKLEKELSLSEDEIKRQQDEVQKLTDRYTGQLEKLGDDKEKELMSV
jgi:ribosome recycling factor